MIDNARTSSSGRIASSRWPLAARVAVSVPLAWHLVGLLVGPLTLPPSVLGDYLASIYRPYLELTYVDHSYKFFAPDPGPSHHMRYEIEMPDGSVEEGVFPDPGKQSPRLLYHRHLVLCEFFNILPHPDDDPNDARLQQWRLALPGSKAWDLYARSFARHLLWVHGGHHVTLYLAEHRSPTPLGVIHGVRFDDPRLDSERRVGRFGRPRNWGEAGPQAEHVRGKTS
jgi:hypothetical protein